jgi:carbonic anhydrase
VRAAGAARTALGPDEALAVLREGKRAFVAGGLALKPGDSARRLALAGGQAPIAVLVGCSDSRVPPELLFGRGLGELFVVRIAGNTVGTAAALGSVEYAVAGLGVPLVVVLGHERCGAVAAALDVVERGATFPGSIDQLIEPIVPAALRARDAALRAGAGDGPGAVLHAAVVENARRVAARLRSSEAVLVDPLRAGRLKVVAACYDLEDGRVDFLDEAA